MKKLFIFFILVLSLGVIKAQVTSTYTLSSTVKWTVTVKIPVGADTIYQARVKDLVLLENPNVEIKSIASYRWTIDFQIIDVDASFKVNLGCSNTVINLNTGLRGFVGFANDSLPSTVSNTAWIKTVNGTSQNIRRFTSSDSYGCDLPAFQLYRLTATPGKTIKVTFEFNK